MKNQTESLKLKIQQELEAGYILKVPLKYREDINLSEIKVNSLSDSDYIYGNIDDVLDRYAAAAKHPQIEAAILSLKKASDQFKLNFLDSVSYNFDDGSIVVKNDCTQICESICTPVKEWVCNPVCEQVCKTVCEVIDGKEECHTVCKNVCNDLCEWVVTESCKQVCKWVCNPEGER